MQLTENPNATNARGVAFLCVSSRAREQTQTQTRGRFGRVPKREWRRPGRLPPGRLPRPQPARRGAPRGCVPPAAARPRPPRGPARRRPPPRPRARLARAPARPARDRHRRPLPHGPRGRERQFLPPFRPNRRGKPCLFPPHAHPPPEYVRLGPPKCCFKKLKRAPGARAPPRARPRRRPERPRPPASPRQPPPAGRGAGEARGRGAGRRAHPRAAAARRPAGEASSQPPPQQRPQISRCLPAPRRHIVWQYFDSHWAGRAAARASESWGGGGRAASARGVGAAGGREAERARAEAPRAATPPGHRF